MRFHSSVISVIFNHCLERNGGSTMFWVRRNGYPRFVFKKWVNINLTNYDENFWYTLSEHMHHRVSYAVIKQLSILSISILTIVQNVIFFISRLLWFTNLILSGGIVCQLLWYWKYWISILKNITNAFYQYNFLTIFCHYFRLWARIAFLYFVGV